MSETDVAEPNVADIARSHPANADNFAKWIGIDPESLKDAPAADTEDAAEVPSTTDPVAGTDDAAEPVKLPFEAMTDDAPMDAAVLAKMQLTFNANGKQETVSLADVVRRAQSEPGIQQQARQFRLNAEQLQQEKDARDGELEQVRAIALRMARDHDFHATVTQQLEQYDAPESRADRAEQALATERKRQQETSEQEQFNTTVQSFGMNVVAPTLNDLFTKYPNVNPQEIMGQFTVDTQPILVNGIIPPSRHDELAAYLRGPLMQYAEQRHNAMEADKAKIADEVRKTQIERQKVKNQAASITKPLGNAPSLREEPASVGRPTTYKQASDSALRALLGSATA